MMMIIQYDDDWFDFFETEKVLVRTKSIGFAPGIDCSSHSRLDSWLTTARVTLFPLSLSLRQLGHDWNDWSVLDQWKTFIQKEWFDWRFCFPTTSIPKFHIVKSGGVQSAGNDKSRWLGNDNNITAPPWRRGFLLRSEVFLICSCYHQQLRWFHEKGDNSS